MKEKRAIVIALMIITFLGAIEGTVVSTAMPTIARDLNGYADISWIFSAYLLTTAVSTPIYGKLSDLYGRKRMIIIGMGIFLLGTILSGVAQNISELIIFRAIQGLGTGAIFTLTYAIIGDIFTKIEKVKMQGLISSVWGIAGVLGPLLGGAILTKLSWHWIFFINIPFALLGMYMLNKNLHENIVKRTVKIDYLGIIFLTIFIVSLLLATSETDNTAVMVSCIIVFIISIILFFIIEKRADEPVVPGRIFNKTTVIINIISFSVAGILIAMQSYMPIYTQNVLGYTPLGSGLLLLPLTAGWILATVLLARILQKLGEKVILIAAVGTIIIASILMLEFSLDTSISFIIIAMFIIGIGLGSVLNTSIIVAQESVEVKDIGVATSTVTLIRTIGQTIMVAIVDIIMNKGVLKLFSTLGYNAGSNLNVEKAKLVLGELNVRRGFLQGMHNVFMFVLVIAVITIVVAVLLPKRKVKEDIA